MGRDDDDQLATEHLSRRLNIAERARRFDLQPLSRPLGRRRDAGIDL